MKSIKMPFKAYFQLRSALVFLVSLSLLGVMLLMMSYLHVVSSNIDTHGHENNNNNDNHYIHNDETVDNDGRSSDVMSSNDSIPSTSGEKASHVDVPPPSPLLNHIPQTSMKQKEMLSDHHDGENIYFSPRASPSSSLGSDSPYCLYDDDSNVKDENDEYCSSSSETPKQQQRINNYRNENHRESVQYLVPVNGQLEGRMNQMLYCSHEFILRYCIRMV